MDKPVAQYYRLGFWLIWPTVPWKKRKSFLRQKYIPSFCFEESCIIDHITSLWKENAISLHFYSNSPMFAKKKEWKISNRCNLYQPPQPPKDQPNPTCVNKRDLQGGYGNMASPCTTRYDDEGIANCTFSTFNEFCNSVIKLLVSTKKVSLCIKARFSSQTNVLLRGFPVNN